MTHVLVILEPGEEYVIEHAPDCPTEDWLTGPDGVMIKLHTCLVGTLYHEAGLEFVGGAPDDDWRKLAAGRYEIEAWSQVSPAGPWGPAEWDAGIMLTEKK